MAKIIFVGEINSGKTTFISTLLTADDNSLNNIMKEQYSVKNILINGIPTEIEF